MLISEITQFMKEFYCNEPIEDENGHQLHCTGIICAKDNQTGMGVAAGKCISVKALAKNGGEVI